MERSKPPIILLHGALGVAEDLAPIETYFNEQGHRTYSFTFSGHGKSTPDAPEFRIDTFAHELDSFITRNNIQAPVVFGHSMGGYVALYHKANFETSPIKMIFTYGTKFNWSEKAVLKELPMLDPDHLLEKFPAMTETLKSKHGERWKQLLRSTAHMMQHLEKLDGLTREDLSEVDIPVYLILGDQDRMVSTEETQLASDWLLHSHIKMLPHSKHDLERSNLRELSRMILEQID